MKYPDSKSTNYLWNLNLKNSGQNFHPTILIYQYIAPTPS